MSSIIFERIRAKNFRSAGNETVEFDFTKSNTTLVTSLENGDGKSTMTTHAVTYVLFDKAYDKGCKKTSLINNRSNKDCLVELDFKTNGHQWTVRRGMKPNVFDIIKDGARVEDEAALKDYQAYLLSVLGFDEKVFQSSVALGKDKYIPFVEMSAPERRSYVEQMLDITIFSDMNEKTKEVIRGLRRDIEQSNYGITNAETRLNGANSAVGAFDAQVQRAQGSIQQEIDSMNVELNAHQSAMDALRAEALTQFDALKTFDDSGLENISKMEQMIWSQESEINRLQKQVDGLNNLTTCPTCKQEVGADHKAHINGESESNITRMQNGLGRAKPALELLKRRATERSAIVSAVEALKTSINSKTQLINSVNARIASAERLKTQSVDLSQRDALVTNVQAIEQEIGLLKARQTELAESEAQYSALQLLLKDDGAKAEVIKTYIPYLNQEINKILNELGLFISLQMDNEFNMEMFAPDRKGQTVENLSSGQKCRVNLAIMLAWRNVAKQKATVDSNILIMDEVMESLSAAGVVDFMEMWEKIDNGTRLIVITQRNQEFREHFDRVIKYGRKDDLLYVVSDEMGV